MSKTPHDPLEGIIRYFQSAPIAEAARTVVVARVIVESRQAPLVAPRLRRVRTAAVPVSETAPATPAMTLAETPAAAPTPPTTWPSGKPRGRPVGAVDRKPRTRTRKPRAQGLAASHARGADPARPAPASTPATPASVAPLAGLPDQTTDEPDLAAGD
jgi:hypothetical protein